MGTRTINKKDIKAETMISISITDYVELLHRSQTLRTLQEAIEASKITFSDEWWSHAEVDCRQAEEILKEMMCEQILRRASEDGFLMDMFEQEMYWYNKRDGRFYGPGGDGEQHTINWCKEYPGFAAIAEEELAIRQAQAQEEEE